MKIRLNTALVIFLFFTQTSFAGGGAINSEPEQHLSKKLQNALVDYANVALLTILDENRHNFLCTESILEKMDSDMNAQVNGLFLLSQPPNSAVNLNPSLMKKIKLGGVLKMKTPEIRTLMRDMYPTSSVSLNEAQKCITTLADKYKAN